MIKLLKIFTSGELISMLDTNGDGRIQLSEIKNAPFHTWLEIAFKYLPLLLEHLYFAYF